MNLVDLRAAWCIILPKAMFKLIQYERDTTYSFKYLGSNCTHLINYIETCCIKGHPPCMFVSPLVSRYWTYSWAGFYSYEEGSIVSKLCLTREIWIGVWVWASVYDQGFTVMSYQSQNNITACNIREMQAMHAPQAQNNEHCTSFCSRLSRSNNTAIRGTWGKSSALQSPREPPSRWRKSSKNTAAQANM